MKKFFESLIEHTINIINLKEKIEVINKWKTELYQSSNICYICQEKCHIYKYCKVRDQCHYTGECRGAAHSLCNLKYILRKEIPVVFHNSHNYDYHFIIKELAEEFEKQCKCLWENTEKHITFSVPIEKEIMRIDKSGKEIKTISYRLQSIDSTRFMASLLPNLVNSLAGGIHRIKCKYGQ